MNLKYFLLWDFFFQILQANDDTVVFSLETRHDMLAIFFLEDSDWFQTSPSGAHWRKSQPFRYY